MNKHLKITSECSHLELVKEWKCFLLFLSLLRKEEKHICTGDCMNQPTTCVIDLVWVNQDVYLVSNATLAASTKQPVW